MKVSLSIPSSDKLSDFLQIQKDKSFSYSNVGDTKQDLPDGFDNDYNTVYLGTGEEVWSKAKKAINNWQQFPESWTKIFPDSEPIENGKIVAVLFQVLGVWWINSARIVYTIDEANRYGFAYGTLPGHLEKGEECFWVERDEQGAVYYHIKAFSRPAYWVVWLVYPFARKFQRQFVKQSLSIMKMLSNP